VAGSGPRDAFKLQQQCSCACWHHVKQQSHFCACRCRSASAACHAAANRASSSPPLAMPSVSEFVAEPAARPAPLVTPLEVRRASTSKSAFLRMWQDSLRTQWQHRCGRSSCKTLERNEPKGHGCVGSTLECYPKAARPTACDRSQSSIASLPVKPRCTRARASSVRGAV